MRMHEYDEARNVELLRQLPVPLRVVFALLCVLRILPSYQRFYARTGRGGPRALESLVERLWSDVTGKQMTGTEAQEAVQEAMRLVPSEEDGWDEETQPYAEDAAAALAYAIRARVTEDPQEAAWAARRVYEAADHFVLATAGMASGGRESEALVLAHPVVQAELARQERDLQDLVALAASGEPMSRLSEMRKRSEREADEFFRRDAQAV